MRCPPRPLDRILIRVLFGRNRRYACCVVEPRDEFTGAVKNLLARRVAFRCSSPSCGRATVGPRHLDDESASIGVAAHITAAAPGGPRYDATLSPQQRSSASNGIWLCQSHARLIDADPEGYPVALLHECRAAAEERARGELNGSGPALAQEPSEIGIPIKNMVDPFAYEVHRAIEEGSSAPDESARSLLPLYVPRRHDATLAAVVREADSGKSRIAVLVGGSSTGKTRAWWEAVHALPERWRVWHPIAPERPEALARDLDAVRPYTVIWLNEAQHYLLTSPSDGGIELASRLRELLRDPTRAPVLVAGTLWLEHWQTVTAEPSAGGPDPHGHARALLTGHDIKVAERFGEEDLDRLTAYAPNDPRLETARDAAPDGMITQYLAGGPALVARYRTASPAARAVIEAAMDARRLGHGIGIPRSFFEHAAPGYLTDSEWDLLDDSWLDDAFKYCGGSLRGARGPLVRIKPRPGESKDGASRYRLADYLEQYGREARKRTAVPRSFWDACAATCTWQDQRELAESARQRGLLRVATSLSRSQSAITSATTLIKTAELMRRFGGPDEAIPYYEAAYRSGDREAASELAKIHQDAGWTEQALDWYRKAALAGDPTAARTYYTMLNDAGLDELALEWLESTPDLSITMFGNPRRNTEKRARQVETAVGVLEERAQAGDLKACAQLAELLAWDEGRGDEAHFWGMLSVEGADGTDAADELRDWDWLIPHHCTSAASSIVSWLVKRASAGDDTVLHPMAYFIARCSHDHPEALSALQRRAAAGNAEGLRALAAFLSKAGFEDAAIAWQRTIHPDDDRFAEFDLAEMLWQAGHQEEALAQFRIATDAEPGESDYLTAAAEHLRDADRFSEAVEWCLDAAEIWSVKYGDLASMLREAVRGSAQERHIAQTRKRLNADLEKLRTWSPASREEWANLDERLDAARLELRAYGEAPNAIWRARHEGRFIGDISEYYQPLAEQGEVRAVWVMCQLAIGAGRHDEPAIRWCEQAIAAGFEELQDDLALMLASAGRVEDALRTCTRAAAQGHAPALLTAVEVLKTGGHTSDAERLRRFGWAADYSIEQPWEPEPVNAHPASSAEE
jgi:tetratricopeptide (TPR) repeat protein